MKYTIKYYSTVYIRLKGIKRGICKILDFFKFKIVMEPLLISFIAELQCFTEKKKTCIQILHLLAVQ